MTWFKVVVSNPLARRGALEAATRLRYIVEKHRALMRTYRILPSPEGFEAWHKGLLRKLRETYERFPERLTVSSPIISSSLAHHPTSPHRFSGAQP